MLALSRMKTAFITPRDVMALCTRPLKDTGENTSTVSEEYRFRWVELLTN